MLLMSLSSSSISILPRNSTLKLLNPLEVFHRMVPLSDLMLVLTETPAGRAGRLPVPVQAGEAETVQKYW